MEAAERRRKKKEEKEKKAQEEKKKEAQQKQRAEVLQFWDDLANRSSLAQVAAQIADRGHGYWHDWVSRRGEMQKSTRGFFCSLWSSWRPGDCSGVCGVQGAQVIAAESVESTAP